MARNHSFISRRRFLTAGTAAIAAPALVKASSGFLSSEAIAQDNTRPLTESSADLIIIGGGGSGLAAAVAAAEHGINNITVLETLNVMGGNSVYPEGIFGAESKVLKEKGTGMQMTGDEAFKSMMDAGRWRLNASLVRALIDGSGETVDWLAEMGVDFGMMASMGGPPGARGGSPAEDSFTDIASSDSPSAGEPSRSATPASSGGAGKAIVRIGSVIVQTLVKRCRELGVKIIMETEAKQLLKGRDGRISGVLAKQKNGDLKISGKCVIIATGGFTGNSEMMSKYLPPFQESDNVFVGGIAHKGDGIKMAREAGAGMEPRGATEFAMDRFMVPGGPGPESIYLIFITMKQSVLSINKKGERVPDNMNNVWRQPGKVTYLLFDERMKQEFYKSEAPEYERKLFGTSPWWKNKINELTDVWVNVEKDLKTFAEKGGVKIANSWDEMAGWMGISPDVLAGTINEYNAGCDSGNDSFGRDKRSLSPLRTPPFYAITCGLTLLVTHGVIKTNKKMQVLDTNEDPIPGLYVAGDDIGGVDEDIYGSLGGHSIGFALTSGRLAGINAASFLAKA